MVAIYKDRFRDASDFTFYLTKYSLGRARELVEHYLGAILSINRKEEPVEYHLRRSVRFGNDRGKSPG
ncbi:MAG: hypothetical protein ACLU4J_12705 [Butyricimonas paravirosa]